MGREQHKKELQSVCHKYDIWLNLASTDGRGGVAVSAETILLYSGGDGAIVRRRSIYHRRSSRLGVFQYCLGRDLETAVFLDSECLDKHVIYTTGH